MGTDGQRPGSNTGLISHVIGLTHADVDCLARADSPIWEAESIPTCRETPLVKIVWRFHATDLREAEAMVYNAHSAMGGHLRINHLDRMTEGGRTRHV